jgi:hypothetical protein
VAAVATDDAEFPIAKRLSPVAGFDKGEIAHRARKLLAFGKAFLKLNFPLMRPNT